MYDLFIKNTTLAQGEQRIYGVPISEAEAEANIPFTDPVIKTEMGKTGSCEFSMNPVNPYYNALRQMKTILRVVYDGTTLFRGRVLTIDNSPLTGEKKVHLEGDLAFLMDSIQEGVKEEDRPEITILAYLTQLITNHNAQMNEDANSDKTFTLGEVPGHYTAATNAAQRVVVDGNHKFGNNSWVTTTSALENLAKEYGGYFRTRYVGGVCYLDWLDYCFQYDVNGQPIEIQENLIDLNSTTEVDNLFTALIPIGKADAKDLFIDGYNEDIHGANKRILVPDIVSLFTDEQLNKGYHSKADYQNAVSNYGILYKTQSFPNADTKEKLWNYAIDWIRENYVGGITSFDLSALDMHHLDGEVQKYLTGDRVQVIYPNMSAHTEGSTPTITKTLTLISAQYYLYNPEKNKYSLGVPNLLLNREYGTSLNKESSGGGSSGGSGGYKKKQKEETKTREEQIAEYRENAWKYIVDKKNNFEIYEQLYNEDPVKADRALNFTHATLVEGMMASDGSSTAATHKRRFQKMWFDGLKQSIDIAGPVDHSHDYTDEQIAAINEANHIMTIDGLSKSIGWYATLNTVPSPSEMQRGNLLMLQKVGLIRDPYTGQLKEAANIKLWNDSRSASDTAPSEVTVNGFGEVANKYLKVGKNGEGDLATVMVNGLQSTVEQFDPSTVIAGVTPTKTVEQDGKNGGSMAAGSGGDLDGWKITLNRPLTYHATIDGEQQTFTVPAGVVAADDIHFTKKYDSLYAEVAMFDEMYADYSHIGTLVALKASVDDLDADWVKARLADIQTLSTGSITCAGVTSSGGNFTTGGAIIGGGIYVGANGNYGSVGTCFSDVSKSQSGDDITLTFSRADGSTAKAITFSKPASVRVQSLGGGGTYGATSSTQHITIHPSSGYDAMSSCHFYIRATSGGGTCFAAGSMVRKTDGSEIPIEQLTPGQMLESFDWTVNKFCETEVISVKQFKNASCIYDLRLSSGRSIVLTSSHPLLTSEGWKAIDPEKATEEHDIDDIGTLKVNDKLIGINELITIEQIVSREDLEGTTVYNIDVEEVDTYIVNGIVAHNANDKN